MYTLNEQQNEICSMGVQSIKYGSNQIFEFDGEAGTGKSVVLYEIIKRSGISMDEVLPMAFTGQAAIIMRKKGFYNAKTIHSSIYNVETKYKRNNQNSIIMNTGFNAPEVVDCFEPKKDLPGKKVMVIDEGYMVPDYMKPDIEKFGLKIIVAGDQGQLPPVKAKPAYLYNKNIPHLTELMRQNENDPIIYLARRARRGLPIHCGLYGNNVLVIEEKDLTYDMIKAADIVLCGTNKTRENMNNIIRRDILGINDTLPVYGDRMICRKNNWNKEVEGISLANGLVGTVMNMPDATSFDGKKYQIDFSPDLLQNTFYNLDCDYKYLVAPQDQRALIKNSKYSVGEKFEYAYALSTHLSQGAEWDKGIYIEEYMNPSIQNHLNYTGITRFKKWLIYVKKSQRHYY